MGSPPEMQGITQNCKAHQYLHHSLRNNKHIGQSMLRKGTIVILSVFYIRP